MRSTRFVAGLFVAVLAVSVLAVETLDGEGGPSGSDPVRLDTELAAALQSFDGCDDAVEYFVGAATAQARGGFDDMDSRDFASDGAVAEESAAPLAPTAQAGGGEGEPFSATNVQEVGVDEPDVVKTDGRRIVALAGGNLHVLDVSGGDARRTGTLDLPGDWAGELLLDGDRALVTSTVWTEPVPRPRQDGEPTILPHGGPSTALTLVDLTDPAAPRVASTLTLEGEYVSARMVDGVARVVLRSHPTSPVMDGPGVVDGRGVMVDPPVAPDAGPPPDELAPAPAGAPARTPTAATPAEPIDDWVPHYRLDDGATVTEDRLVGCDAIYRPVEAAGTGMVSVLSVDLAGDLRPQAAASVVADAQTVYASTDTLYVAFTSWAEGGETTEIHAFDITDPSAAVYSASGAVPGRLLNQWALSEHEGHLRVATTEGDSFAGPMPERMPVEPGVDAPAIAPAPTPSHSAVTVLAPQGEELVQVGRVEGLGPTERIYAVRFMGDVGYVVTFRETDPLYTLDLADPADPRVLGELKILGYSAYLHPVGEGVLLGVGQDATEDGQRLGTQLSLFDVSDLANPTRTHQTTIRDATSAVEHDHRAFLHWPATGTVVLPLETWSPQGQAFVGAAAFTVDPAAGIAERGRLSHAAHVDDPWFGAIRRALVIGDTLYTVSEAGVQAADLGSLAEQSWVGFN